MKTNKRLTTSIFCKNIVKYNTIQIFFFSFQVFHFLTVVTILGLQYKSKSSVQRNLTKKSERHA